MFMLGVWPGEGGHEGPSQGHSSVLTVWGHQGVAFIKLLDWYLSLCLHE